MKKQLLFLMLFAGGLLAFTGCKKDDDDAEVSIEGTWELQKSDYKYYVNDELDESESETDDVTDWSLTLTIKDGKWKVVEKYNSQENVSEGTYVYSNNRLVISGDDENIFTVKTLTGNSLVLVSDRTGEYDNNGVTVTYREVTEDTYSK